MHSERRAGWPAARPPTRRLFFSRIADGLHGAALASLLGADTGIAASPAHRQGAANLAVRPPDFEPRAKSVIHLFMNGGPSQVDMFDPKPLLRKYEGQDAPRDILSKIEFADEIGGLLPSPFEFAPCGQCGMEVSELLPHFTEIADEVTLIRSMWGESFNHEPSLYLMHSGRILPGRPSLGSWVVYGLGSENRNLPGYVVLDDPKKLPVNGIQNWQSGWLPPVFQGTRVRSEDPPLLNLHPAEQRSSPLVEAERDLLRRLNRGHLSERPWQPDLQARISSYELAARMQLAAPEALDISQESEATRQMYGIDREETASYGTRCLMARRLVERGVRFVQIFIEYQIWDAHSDLEESLRYSCGKTDQPIAALIKDLKQRGLLDSTLVIWGGEFGRMPLGQVRDAGSAGRDHGPDGFSMWMAGGGVKRGHVHGITDDLGHKAVEGRVSVHDFHATMLHLLGMDHRELTHERHGLQERLTDQYPARVVTELLA
ncbi:MAG: DUF1501 domain-containing protein [Bryobacterales bacterium]|nr:DUF1501 domain-containing protein [Bryobacterales bacterium]MDE0626012.1 DUF1501 domain-containing protein [Bryobacterales bacterium]